MHLERRKKHFGKRHSPVGKKLPLRTVKNLFCPRFRQEQLLVGSAGLVLTPGAKRYPQLLEPELHLTVERHNSGRLALRPQGRQHPRQYFDVPWLIDEHYGFYLFC